MKLKLLVMQIQIARRFMLANREIADTFYAHIIQKKHILPYLQSTRRKINKVSIMAYQIQTFYEIKELISINEN